jgi:4-oxalomesaconate tautomerase
MGQTAIPCVAMRGGTSKGLYFLAGDLPRDAATRDRVLLAAMGSPDERQIDGMGGSHPLTSKVAIVGPPTRDDADVDYLFLQVVVDSAEVRDNQNCGNILAGVGPFAIEQGLVPAADGETTVRIHMVNSGSISVAHVQTPGGQVAYDGNARIDGVPGSAAPVTLDFEDTAGSSCGALLPTGNAVDTVDGVEVTCIDNGMPVVIMRAADLGVTGRETPEELEANEALRAKVESIRLAAGEKMNLGDVTDKTVPKMCLAAAPVEGGAISTRMFIPHRVHESVGVLAAASVAAACLIEGTIAEQICGMEPAAGVHRIDVEHPTGFLTVELEAEKRGDSLEIVRTALLRTARKLMAGDVFVPAAAWSGAASDTRAAKKLRSVNA